MLNKLYNNALIYGILLTIYGIGYSQSTNTINTSQSFYNNFKKEKKDIIHEKSQNVHNNKVEYKTQIEILRRDEKTLTQYETYKLREGHINKLTNEKNYSETQEVNISTNNPIQAIYNIKEKRAISLRNLTKQLIKQGKASYTKDNDTPIIISTNTENTNEKLTKQKPGKRILSEEEQNQQRKIILEKELEQRKIKKNRK